MKELLFSAQGRIGRARFWLGIVCLIGLDIVAGIILKVMSFALPGEVTEDGSFHVSGAAAIPYIVIVFATLGLFVWSSICLNIKRYHDRGKSGVWLLVIFIPFIGSIWNFIETGCLRGTIGPNAYGPDPLATIGGIGDAGFAPVSLTRP